MYKEVIADVETLDTKPSSVVVSIGLVKFNLDEQDSFDTLDDPARSFYAVLDIDHQITHHARTLSGSTIKWWMTQDSQARALFRGAPVSVPDALKAMIKWVGKTDSNLWGNGATFDNMILMSLFEDYGMAFPFRYWENLDLRTLKYLAGSPKVSIPKGVAHNALDDAKHEALCAQHYFQVINR